MTGRRAAVGNVVALLLGTLQRLWATDLPPPGLGEVVCLSAIAPPPPPPPPCAEGPCWALTLRQGSQGSPVGGNLYVRDPWGLRIVCARVCA